VCVTELGVMRSIPSVHGGYVIMREEIYGVVLRCHSLFKSDSTLQSVHVRVFMIEVKV
jgi:hypothetical protein